MAAHKGGTCHQAGIGARSAARVLALAVASAVAITRLRALPASLAFCAADLLPGLSGGSSRQRALRWRAVCRRALGAHGSTETLADPELADLSEPVDISNSTVSVETRSLSEQLALPGFFMTALAGIGALDCGYLTSVKLGQTPLICPASSAAGCTQALDSSWAMVGPVPLAAIGLAAYVAVMVLSRDPDWAQRSLLWWLCFSMALASLGLMALLIFGLHAPCTFCAASALASALLLAISEAGQARVSSSEPRRAIIGLASVVAVGAFRAATMPAAADGGEQDYYDYSDLAQRYKPEHPPLRSVSSPAEKALARHLAAVGAACYTAWWCPHCQDQREQFGIEAAALAPFVQCSAAARWQLPACRDKGIDGYPTWIIGGQKYQGIQALSELAKLTGFTEFPPEAFRPRDKEATAYIWD